MNDVKVIEIEELDDKYRADRLLMMLEENDIKNTTFKNLIKITQEVKMPVVVMMPENQYKPGLRGYAKIKILAALLPEFAGVMPVSLEQVKLEISHKWGKIFLPEKKQREVVIAETRDSFDASMIDKTFDIVQQSNCWYNPAGCVIVLNGKIVSEATSTSWDKENFDQIPFKWQELELAEGERMNFGETMHSEPLAIAIAAKNGVKLEGATIYLTKFPCLPCASVIIGAGIKKVVFEDDSYGLADAHILAENGVELVKIVRSS